jgi:prevent-host-death family protein
MNISVADIKAQFTAYAKLADQGEEVIITNRGIPSYRLVPVNEVPKRAKFPDLSLLAKQCKTYEGDNFVADWRAQNERF